MNPFSYESKPELTTTAEKKRTFPEKSLHNSTFILSAPDFISSLNSLTLKWICSLGDSWAFLRKETPSGRLLTVSWLFSRRAVTLRLFGRVDANELRMKNQHWGVFQENRSKTKNRHTHVTHSSAELEVSTSVISVTLQISCFLLYNSLRVKSWTLRAPSYITLKLSWFWMDSVKVKVFFGLRGKRNSKFLDYDSQRRRAGNDRKWVTTEGKKERGEGRRGWHDVLGPAIRGRGVGRSLNLIWWTRVDFIL